MRSGGVERRDGKRGAVWSVRYRDATGRRVRETLGPEADGWELIWQALRCPNPKDAPTLEQIGKTLGMSKSRVHDKYRDLIPKEKQRRGKKRRTKIVEPGDADKRAARRQKIISGTPRRCVPRLPRRTSSGRCARSTTAATPPSRTTPPQATHPSP